MHNFLNNHPGAGAGFAVFGGFFAVIIIAAVVWTLAWKGIALWHAARNHQTAWFIVLLIVNTLGILEILYLIFWRKNKNGPVAVTHVTTTTTTSTPTSPLPPTTGDSSSASV